MRIHFPNEKPFGASGQHARGRGQRFFTISASTTDHAEIPELFSQSKYRELGAFLSK